MKKVLMMTLATMLFGSVACTDNANRDNRNMGESDDATVENGTGQQTDPIGTTGVRDPVDTSMGTTGTTGTTGPTGDMGTTGTTGTAVGSPATGGADTTGISNQDTNIQDTTVSPNSPGQNTNNNLNQDMNQRANQNSNLNNQSGSLRGTDIEEGQGSTTNE